MATSLYTSQKFLNNTYYHTFKDLAFIARKNKNNIKIFQDVCRPDIYKLLAKLDKRQKLGFLQLQILVGLAKFDSKINSPNPITFETDSHGIIRKTFLKLTELGYLKNYEENYLKDSHLIIEKLAFGTTDITSKVPIYNMHFQRTEKNFNFDDPDFQKMFPMVFAKRGILEKQGYEIQKNENGEFSINYKSKTPKITPVKKEPCIRDTLKCPISLESQKEHVQNILSNTHERTLQEKDTDKDK